MGAIGKNFITLSPDSSPDRAARKIPERRSQPSGPEEPRAAGLSPTAKVTNCLIATRLDRSPDVITAARRLANYLAAVPVLVATELAVRPVSAIVASTSAVIDVSRRSAAVRAAAERLLTTPPMSRISTLIVSDAA